MRGLAPRRLFALAGILPKAAVKLRDALCDLLPLPCRALLSAQARVRKDLSDRAKEVEGLAGKHRWFDHKVLTWDYEVRSILRRHLSPDHLGRYERATALSASDENDILASAEAMRRGLHEIEASIEAVAKKTVIPTGGLSDQWWFRATLVAGVGTAFGLLVNQMFVPDLMAGGDPNLLTQSDPVSGATRDVVTDPGKAVAISPTPSATPGATRTPVASPTPTVATPTVSAAPTAVVVATPTVGAAPTPTAVLLLSEGPVINPPTEPEEGQPVASAEDAFRKGVDALEAGDFETAVDEFEIAIKEEPGFVRAYYNLAMAYDRIGTEEARQAAVDNYTAAIDLWNSLGTDGDGLLFQAKLGRGLLLVGFSTDKQAICVGQADLLEYLDRGDPTQRNTEVVNKALAGVDVHCEEPQGSS